MSGARESADFLTATHRVHTATAYHGGQWWVLHPSESTPRNAWAEGDPLLRGLSVQEFSGYIGSPLVLEHFYPMTEAQYRTYLFDETGTVRPTRVLHAAALSLWLGVSVPADITDAWMETWSVPVSATVAECFSAVAAQWRVHFDPSDARESLADLVWYLQGNAEVLVVAMRCADQAFTNFPAALVMQWIDQLAPTMREVLDAGIVRRHEWGIALSSPGMLE